jgi:hypothetical protein
LATAWSLERTLEDEVGEGATSWTAASLTGEAVRYDPDAARTARSTSPLRGRPSTAVEKQRNRKFS